MLITLFSQQAASANEALFGWFQMLPLLCQSSCCKRLNQRKGTQIWTMLLEKDHLQDRNLCVTVSPFELRRDTSVAERVGDSQGELSFFSVLNAAGARGINLWLLL